MSGEFQNKERRTLKLYMKELGVVMHAAEVGLTEDLIKEIAESTRIMSGGYRTLTTEEIEEILRESM